MRKKEIILVGLLLLAGCSKSIEIPKLMANEINLDYGETIEFEYENLVDLSKFSEKQIDELEKNGDIDLREIKYDEQGFIVPGEYQVKVSYYNDVVRTIIKVADNAIPRFVQLDEVEVPWSWQYYDFSEVIYATSPLDLKMDYTFDTSDINFYERGYYPLHVTVKDEEGRVNNKTFKVHVV